MYIMINETNEDEEEIILQFNDIYELGDLLGQGTFSEVRIATKKGTKESFAVKLIKKDNINDE